MTRAQRAGTKLSKVVVGENPPVVAVAKGELEGVIADRFRLSDVQWRSGPGNRKRNGARRGFQGGGLASHAGTFSSKIRDFIKTAVIVGPYDFEGVFDPLNGLRNHPLPFKRS